MASYQGEPSNEMEHASVDPDMPDPGLLTFRKLAVNKGQITRVEEKMMESTIKNQETIIRTDMYCEQFHNAARNVKGVMLYHSYKKNEAIKMWKETLASDPTNLNALKDLTDAYQKLCYNLKAQEYKTKLRDMIQGASNGDKKMMFARCQVEQGYALFQDLHTQSWKGIELCQEQVRCFEAALKMAEDLIDQDEKRDWLLYTGKAYDRLCHACFRAGREELYIDSIGKAIAKLHEAFDHMPEKNAFYQAEIWLTIGNIFGRSVMDSTYKPPPIVKQFYEDDWKDPMRCYKRALELNPDNVWLLGRKGMYHFKQGNYTDALADLDQSIEIAEKLPAEDPQKKSSSNALCHRAKIFIKMAKRDGTPVEYVPSHLLLAQRDANKALELNYCPFTLTVAGDVHHMLAKNPLTPPKDVESYRDIALERFYEASVTQDGSTILDVHLKRAECLQDAGDLQSAIESFQLAFDSTKTGTDDEFCASLASKLLHAMLQHYKNLDKPQHLIGEIAFWLIYTHKSCQLIRYKIKELCRDYAPQIVDVLEYINHNLSSTEQDLNTEIIETFIDTMTDLLEDRNFQFSILCSLNEDFPDRLTKLTKQTKQREKNRNLSLPQRTESEPAANQQDDVRQVRNAVPLTEGVDFDFYILYEGENPEIRGWIRYSLLRGLEGNFFNLKGHYHQKLGELDHESKAQVMKKSAKILIVLSHSFDGNKNLTTEIAQCIKAKNVEDVIVLLRELVEVPTHLRCYKKFDFTVQVDLQELARYLLPVHSMWNI